MTPYYRLSMGGRNAKRGLLCGDRTSGSSVRFEAMNHDFLMGYLKLPQPSCLWVPIKEFQGLGLGFACYGLLPLFCVPAFYIATEPGAQTL